MRTAAWSMLLLMVALAVGAHGGEDHAEPARSTATAAHSTARVFETQTESFEGVLKFAPAPSHEPLPVHFFLSDFATNAPVAGAKVSLSFPDLKLDVAVTPSASLPGVYEATFSPGLDGSFAGIASVTSGDASDLLLFDAVTFGEASPKATSTGSRSKALGAILVAALVVVVGAAVIVARRRHRIPRSGVALLLLAAIPATGRAHGGEDHGAGPRAAGPATVAVVTKEAQFAFAIRTIVATPVELRARRELRGTVMAPPNGKAVVIAPQAGVVAATGAALPKVGDRVRAGQPLLAVEGFLSPQEQVDVRTALADADARRVAASKELALARSQSERYESVPEVISRREREEASARLESARAADEAAERAVQVLRASAGGTRASATRYVVAAPLDGVITSGTATLGEAVEAGHRFFTIVDMSRPWVRVDVPESNAALLALPAGSQARIASASSASVSIAATFVSASRSVDPATRTVPVYLEADGSSGALLEGQFVEVHADTGAATTGFLVPSSAIVEVSGRTVVFSHVHAEEFAPRDVQLGVASEGNVEVLSGISEGERIVVTGASQIRAALLSGT